MSDPGPSAGPAEEAQAAPDLDEEEGEEEDEAGAAAAGSASAEEQVLASLQVSAEDVERLLCIKQRCGDGRAHPAWLDGRRNRLTASRFASACGVVGARSSPQSVVSEMLALPEGNPGQAGRFGVQHEPVAREAYVDHLHGCCRCCCAATPGSEAAAAAEAEPIAHAVAADADLEVHEVGLCVWREEPWLAASPDGVCWEGENPRGLLEIKTARYWPQEWDAVLEGNLPHDWRYQVQGCLHVASMALGASLAWCDLFLWCPERHECRRVFFDAELWEGSMLPGLRAFYFERFLPAAAQRVQNRRRRAKTSARKRAERRRKR